MVESQQAILAAGNHKGQLLWSGGLRVSVYVVLFLLMSLMKRTSGDAHPPFFCHRFQIAQKNSIPIFLSTIELQRGRKRERREKRSERVGGAEAALLLSVRAFFFPPSFRANR
jgi:hypothetical protein